MPEKQQSHEETGLLQIKLDSQGPEHAGDIGKRYDDYSLSFSRICFGILISLVTLLSRYKETLLLSPDKISQVLLLADANQVLIIQNPRSWKLMSSTFLFLSADEKLGWVFCCCCCFEILRSFKFFSKRCVISTQRFEAERVIFVVSLCFHCCQPNTN